MEEEAKRTMVVCANATYYHKTPLILIGKYTLCEPNMSSQICCTKVCLDGHFNMLELVQWGFLSWDTQENLVTQFFSLWVMVQTILRHLNVTSWKQPCDLGVIAAVKNRFKFLFSEWCNVFLSARQWQPTVT